MVVNKNIMDVNFLERNVKSFNQFYLIMCYMCDYEQNGFEYNRRNLDQIVRHNMEMTLPLPSGRIGNPLAVALEMHRYICAWHMIENAEDLYIDLDDIACTSEDSYHFSASDEFDMSLLSFNEKKRVDVPDMHITEAERHYMQKNIDASIKIEEYLNAKKYIKKAI